MTDRRRGPSRRAARGCRALLVAMLVGVGLVGCDDGNSLVADNRSDVAVLVRIKKAVSTASGPKAAYEVVDVPASSRLVVAVQGFSGNHVIGLEVLTQSCESIGTFLGWEKGTLIRIDSGPMATQAPEWPDDTEPRAAVVDTCPRRPE
jgi:hypothetical protein